MEQIRINFTSYNEAVAIKIEGKWVIYNPIPDNLREELWKLIELEYIQAIVA